MTEVVTEETVQTVVVNAPGSTSVVATEDQPQAVVSAQPSAATVEVDRVQQVTVQELGQPGPPGRQGDPSDVPGPPGEQGIPGPQGPPGQSTTQVVGNLSFVWSQNEPSDTWLIFHNLGFFPAVSIVDSGNNVVEGTIQYIDDNTVQVTFALPFGGTAYLS